jgi:hypothetical protein
MVDRMSIPGQVPGTGTGDGADFIVTPISTLLRR